MSEAERLRCIVLEHVWRKNSDPVRRNYGWSDDELDAMIDELRKDEQS